METRDLSFTYMKGTPYEKHALSGVSLKIFKGEFTAVIGHTGSGKTTLVQHFNGLLKPASGRVLINGTETEGKGLKELRRHVGLVFQYPEHQLFEETVLKDVAFGLIKAGYPETGIREKVGEALEAVGLSTDILDKSPFELSGGQKRRVAIAGIIVTDPEVLILDEPAAGLDPEGRDAILRMVAGLHRSKGITAVLVSHNMEDVAKLVGRIIVMGEGNIIMDGKPCDIFRQTERLESQGLSAPQITYLMKELKERHPYLNDNIFTVEQAANELMQYLPECVHDTVNKAEKE
ncbi:MAG: energy-coupling factor transporter ATPase [Eubacteriales bacterium]|nr:energy-coupling factor transporter ATPase [Eubacteriales bacterium]